MTSTASVSDLLSDLRVLVVDDSRILRKLLIRELAHIGISQITESEDGLQCLDILAKQAFDLVLLDMEMPEMDGLAVLQAIKKTPELRSLPVIVISGDTLIDKTVRCIEIGAEDYLPKPFNPVLLRARIVSVAEKRRLRNLEMAYLNQLQHEKNMLQLEQMKTERLMLNILPKSIAERLKRNEVNIAGDYPNVTVLFSDLVGFTAMASAKGALELVKLLNDLFTRFDKRAEELGLEKIKTIGDAYMAVGGLPIPRQDHADISCDMALGMFEDLADFNRSQGMSLAMRIGLNSGPVVAGVIGFTKFSYDLWGHTVNTASRMESSGESGKIQISPSTFELVKDKFVAQERELIECKGLGKIMTSFLIARK